MTARLAFVFEIFWTFRKSQQINSALFLVLKEKEELRIEKSLQRKSTPQ
jgi:hypothetical protein